MRRITLTFVIIALPVACLGDPPENLIVNAGFETDADGDGTPDGWAFAWQNTHSNDRERGLKLTPEGGKIVSGDHKMANGLQFRDYNELRRKIADAIMELAN